MRVDQIFCYLVHPEKGLDEDKREEVKSTVIKPNNPRLFRLLSIAFEKADYECKHEIAFSPMEDGRQSNDCRNEIIDFVENPDELVGAYLAKRLQSVTTNKSGLGLLFLVLGENRGKKRLYMARFPADIGILAEEEQGNLNIVFVEKVFMRNALAYKAALYEGASTDRDFWIGSAVDKQISDGVREISNYWIRDFLLSELRTTPALGTRRLAIALREAANITDDSGIKSELISAAVLARGLDGQFLSIEEFADRYGFSDKTKEVVLTQLKLPRFAHTQFQFSLEEYTKNIPYKMVEIDNGAALLATVEKFDDCFSTEVVEGVDNVFIFSTTGKIVNQQLRKSK